MGRRIPDSASFTRRFEALCDDVEQIKRALRVLANADDEVEVEEPEVEAEDWTASFDSD